MPFGKSHFKDAKLAFFLRAYSIYYFSIKLNHSGGLSVLMQEGLEGKAVGFLRAERVMEPRKARRQLVCRLAQIFKLLSYIANVIKLW